MNTNEATLRTQTKGGWCTRENEAHRTCCESETARAESLLDQVEEVQAQLQGLIDDVSLLQTTENALDLIAENLAKVRRMTLLKQQDQLSHFDEAEINDTINNLMMVTMLVTEDTEYNGYRLFSDNVIELNGTGSDRLFFSTARLPRIQGIETNDCEAVLDSLTSAARVINRQYERIGKVLRSLLSTYDQIHSNVDQLIDRQTRQYA